MHKWTSARTRSIYKKNKQKKNPNRNIHLNLVALLFFVGMFGSRRHGNDSTIFVDEGEENRAPPSHHVTAPSRGSNCSNGSKMGSMSTMTATTKDPVIFSSTATKDKGLTMTTRAGGGSGPQVGLPCPSLSPSLI